MTSAGRCSLIENRVRLGARWEAVAMACRNQMAPRSLAFHSYSFCSFAGLYSYYSNCYYSDAADDYGYASVEIGVAAAAGLKSYD